MSWLPRSSTQSWMDGDSYGEVEVCSISVAWRSWEIEISFSRHNGRLR